MLEIMLAAKILQHFSLRRRFVTIFDWPLVFCGWRHVGLVQTILIEQAQLHGNAAEQNPHRR